MNEKNTGAIVYRTETVWGNSADIGIYALASLVNGLAAEGGEGNAVRVEAHTFLPPGGKSPHIYEVEKRIKKECARLGVVLDSIRRSPGVPASCYMVSVTGFSTVKESSHGAMRPGQEIVLAKWAGLEGTLRILEEREEELRKRFAPGFLEQIRKLKPEIYAAEVIEGSREAGVTAVRQVGEGGIYAALWRLAEEAQAGLDVDLKKVPVRQETIEICEHFRLNPYQLSSAGAMLMIADAGEELVRILQEKRIYAGVIGHFREDRDKIIQNGGEVRYIDRPSGDEVYKVFPLHFCS